MHGVNSHFGLIPFSTLFLLLAQYLAITAIIAFAVKLLLKDPSKSTILAFAVLTSFFLFGAVKDFLASFPFTHPLSGYRVLLPAIFSGLLLLFLVLKYKETSWKLIARYLNTLLCIFLVYELSILTYNLFSRDNDPDFGDKNHSLVAEYPDRPRASKPDIFWIVMDEYSASAILKQKWNYINPLDSILKNKKFFVTDSATSPYNFTHYSMNAMLDMMYLHGLPNDSIVRFQHMVLGDKSVYRNNVVDFLQRNGYAIKNYTMFDMENMPAHPFIRFHSEPHRLISENTLYARAKKDIGWNFTNLFASDKRVEDSIQLREAFQKIASERNELIQLYYRHIQESATSKAPNFFMLQMMLTHEPFLYNADGSIHPKASFTHADAYIPSVEYANKVLTKLFDHIFNSYRDRDFIIIFLSDHGFKFDESDPYFEESCRIPFAVYSSDQNYEGWRRNLAGVNIFRVLFNKYFNTTFPVLESRTHLLRYHE